MAFGKLKVLLGRRNQRFRCVTTSVISENKPTFMAYITHEVTMPLDNEQLKKLEARIGYHYQLFELFSSYGSVRLYCDTLSDSSAYYLAHPDEWDPLYEDFDLWLKSLSSTERSELVPQWVRNAVVIGEIPSSGNYFLFPISGKEKGRVFEFDHDGFEFIERGKDIYSFVDRISVVNEELISDIGTHTRYSDGETDVQWIPQSYEFG